MAQQKAWLPKEGVVRTPTRDQASKKDAVPPGAAPSLQALQTLAGNRAVTGLLKDRSAEARRAESNGLESVVQRDTPPGDHGDVVDVGEIIVDDGTGKNLNVAYARRTGKKDAKHLRETHTLSREDQNDVNAKRKWFQGAAREAYLKEITPALDEIAHTPPKANAGPPQDRAALMGQVTLRLNGIQKAKADRIRDWLEVEDASSHDPGLAALEAAITIFSGGVGGVFGGLISRGMAEHSLRKEFVYLVGLEMADLASEAAFKKALTWTQQRFEAAGSGVLELKNQHAALALTTPNSAGQAKRYARAVELQSIADEQVNGSEFLKLASELPDGELAFQAHFYEYLWKEISQKPDVFMRELTMGYISLKDAIYIDAPEKASAADITKRREAEFAKNKGERDFRETGTVYLRPTGNGNLGNWGSPNVALDFSAPVAGVKKETLAHLVGSKIKDLPFNFSFRIPAIDPFYHFNPGERGIEIGFSRTPDVELIAARDREDDEREWLASYWSRQAGELSGSQRNEWAIHGVTKLYEALKDRTVTEVHNGDIGLGDAIEINSKLHPSTGGD